MMPLQITSPSPVPPTFRVEPESICWNFLNSFGRSFAAMPSPWSRIETRSTRSATEASMRTLPPAGENLMAFDSRFVTTCVMRCASSMASGSRSGSDSSSLMRRSSSSMRRFCAACCTTGSRRWRSIVIGSDADSSLEKSRMSLMSSSRRSAFAWAIVSSLDCWSVFWK